MDIDIVNLKRYLLKAQEACNEIPLSPYDPLTNKAVKFKCDVDLDRADDNDLIEIEKLISKAVLTVCKIERRHSRNK